MSAGPSPASPVASRPAQWLDGALQLLAAALMFLMMMLTFVDVVGRYLLRMPLPGAYELTEIAMGVMIFMGLPLISARDGHIAVNVLDELLPRWVLRARPCAMDVLVCFCMGALAWVLWGKAVHLAKYGDTTPYLGLPIAPVVYVMAGLSAVTALVMAVKSVRSWRVLRAGGEG